MEHRRTIGKTWSHVCRRTGFPHVKTDEIGIRREVSKVDGEEFVRVVKPDELLNDHFRILKQLHTYQASSRGGECYKVTDIVNVWWLISEKADGPVSSLCPIQH